MVELNRNSPAIDINGRMLYQGVFTDGMNVKSIFFYSYDDSLAFQRAKALQNESGFNLRIKKITRVDQKNKNTIRKSNPI